MQTIITNGADLIKNIYNKENILIIYRRVYQFYVST